MRFHLILVDSDKDTRDKLDKDRFRRDLGDVMAAYKEVLGRLENARN